MKAKNVIDKSHVCTSCTKRFTVNFSPKQEQVKMPCPYCLAYQVIKRPKNK